MARSGPAGSDSKALARLSKFAAVTVGVTLTQRNSNTVMSTNDTTALTNPGRVQNGLCNSIKPRKRSKTATLREGFGGNETACSDSETRDCGAMSPRNCVPVRRAFAKSSRLLSPSTDPKGFPAESTVHASSGANVESCDSCVKFGSWYTTSSSGHG